MKVELTQKEVSLIGWALYYLYADARPKDKLTAKEQSVNIMKKLDPIVTYHYGD